MKTAITLAAALSMAVSAGAAMAASGVSYSGNWPVTVSKSRFTNGTYCVTLKDGGEATVEFEGNGELIGSFFVINRDMAVTFPVPASGQNYGLVFVMHAANGTIGGGILDYVQGGAVGDSGVVTVGQKNSC